MNTFFEYLLLITLGMLFQTWICATAYCVGYWYHRGKNKINETIDVYIK